MKIDNVPMIYQLKQDYSKVPNKRGVRQCRWELIGKFNKRVGPNNRVGRNYSKCDKCVGLF